jgi:2-dehydropantoate 2-reductase
VRVVVYGAGAVGSLIGGRLRQAGVDVVLIARAAHAEAIGVHGLTLRTARGSEVVAIDAVTSVAELSPGDDDVVLITAKTQDVGPIHSQLLAWNSGVPVVCATNGVEHERIALRSFDHVYAMCVQLPAEFEKPGEVTALCAPINAILDIGRYPAGVDETARRLAALIETSPHMSSEADDDVMTKKYGKLLVNLGNAADAACGFGGREARVVSDAINEAKGVLRAAAIRWKQPQEQAARHKARAELMQFDIPDGDTFLGGSTWQSLAKGATTIETDYFNGEIALLGRLHGVPTPANDFLQRYASRLLRDQRHPGSVTVGELDGEWAKYTMNGPNPNG